MKFYEIDLTQSIPYKDLFFYYDLRKTNNVVRALVFRRPSSTELVNIKYEKASDQEVEILLSGNQIIADRIRYKLYTGRQILCESAPEDSFVYIGSSDLNLTEESMKGGFSDYAYINFDFTLSRASSPYNIYAETSIDKLNPREYKHINNAFTSLAMTIPFIEDGAFGEYNTFLLRKSALGYHLNIDFDLPDIEPIALLDLVAKVDTFFPKIFVTSDSYVTPSSESIPEFIPVSGTIGYEEGKPLIKNATLYLKADAGYLPKTKLAVKNGAFLFKVGTMGLEHGDTINVKIGYKMYSNLANCTISL